jgi:hypothetical protein
VDQEESKKHGNGKVLFIIIVIIIILSAIYFKVTGKSVLDILADYRANNSTTQLKGKINFDADSKSSFALIGDAYVQCTKDGIKYNGSSNWNETYTMQNPIMMSEGNIIAVGEIKNRGVYVFNEKGKLYTVQTEAEIVKFAINKLGYLAVITKTDSKYTTKVYNKSGVLLTERIDEIKEIYPVALDISDDGKYLAVSYIDTSSTNYVSRILFYDIENKNEYVDSINFNATIQKKDEIIVMVSYSEGNKLTVVSDKAIMLVDYNGKELWSKSLSNNLTAIELDNKKEIVLALGDAFPSGSEYKSGTVIWYDFAGNKLGSYETKDKIEILAAKGSKILAYGAQTIYGLSNRGNLLWKHIGTQDVNQVLLYDDLSKMLLTYRNSAEIININSKKMDKSEIVTEESTAEESKETEQSSKKVETTKETETIMPTTNKETTTQHTTASTKSSSVKQTTTVKQTTKKSN